MALLTIKKLESHLYGAADILRGGGLDHSEFRDFIYGMIFLRRFSDVFSEEQEALKQKALDRGKTLEQANSMIENHELMKPFVPEESRWNHISKNLHHDIADGLNIALQGLARYNPILEGITDNINFAKDFGNKTLKDKDFRKLITHFDKYSMRDRDFEHSDLLGSAYEYLIYMFAESGGKKGGDFYTPREVVRMMVRIANPQPGMEIYDPCCGSAGMLAFSKRHVEENGGDGTDLSLNGQDYSGSAWVVSKMNMILHGISKRVQIECEDTVAQPKHLDKDGGLRRFDVVLSNPPFGINWSKDGMIFPERFRFGECPQTGKKAELMFVQHMIASLKDNGIAVTVVPHGVLFRGGKEGVIRSGILDADLLEAVISVGPNLFYGTGIPGCILVLRSRKESKPLERQGKVLFINADQEFEEGRAMNVMRPRHAEKILRTYNNFESIDGFSRVVDLDEIRGEQAYNLNVRRYVDNSAPPEPQDVRCHLHGGIPKAEVDTLTPRVNRHGLDPYSLLESVDDKTCRFRDGLSDSTSISQAIQEDPAVKAKEQKLRDAFDAWWSAHASEFFAIPELDNLMKLRESILSTFEEKITPVKLLDTYQVAGAAAGWWYDSFDELRAIQSQGFLVLIGGWIQTIQDFIADTDSNKDKTFDPLRHKLVPKLCGQYLQQLDDLEAAIASLQSEKEAFERGEHLEDPEEEHDGKDSNYYKNTDGSRKELLNSIKADRARIKTLKGGPNVKGAASIKAQERLGEDVTDLKAELARLEANIRPVEEEIAELVAALVPYKDIQNGLRENRAKLKALQNSLVENLVARKDALSDDEARDLVLGLMKEELYSELDGFAKSGLDEVIELMTKLSDKYSITLADIEQSRNNANAKLEGFLKELGYG